MSNTTKSKAIVGERIFLRPPTKRDLAEFIALSRASTRFHRGLVSPPTRPERLNDYLTRSRRSDSASFLICSTAEGAIVGAINLSQIIRGGFQNAYLGYYIGAPYAGKGLMTEAIRLALRYAFSELKLHRLEANIQPGNKASIALVERAGFVREGFSRRYLKISGRWRDHERWAIIAEDWKAMPRSSGQRAKRS